MKFAPLFALHEAVSCAVLGLRDGLAPRIILFSVGMWVGAFAFWCLILLVAWTQVKAIAGFIAAWALLGVFVIFPNWLPAGARSKLIGVPLPVGAETLLGSVFTGATWIALVLMTLLLLVITVRAAMEFGLMPLVRRKVLESYPPFPPQTSTGLLAPIKNLINICLLAVFVGGPCLLIPVVNVFLLLVVFGYLNVRSFVNEALDELASPAEHRSVIRNARGRMILLGSVLGAVQSIPLVGFISPGWVGAGTCHLCFRELLRLRSMGAETKLAAPR